MQINFLPAGNTTEKGTQTKAQQETDAFAKLLEEAQKSNNDEKLKEACQQFESYFLNQMLKGMKNTIPKNDMMPKSYAREIYEGMLDEQYSESMSKAGGIGLAKMLYDDLSKRK
ncbi:MAG: rod-binding protein, partial [Bacillota bacterium]|nr:rod-binding protein [Bacillota bacterium]